jgi:hypothetical protein
LTRPTRGRERDELFEPAANARQPMTDPKPLLLETIMNTNLHAACEAARFELRFQSLFKEGRGYAFDCDASGRVDIDALSNSMRNSYLFARTLIGREYATPVVIPAELH